MKEEEVDRLAGDQLIGRFQTLGGTGFSRKFVEVTWDEIPSEHHKITLP